MRVLLSLLCLLLALASAAQKETANWFLSGSRVAVTPGGISNVTPDGMSAAFLPTNGSTSVADSAGNLLFATDGKTIIDKNLTVMPALTGVNLHGGDKTLAAKIPNSNRYLVFYTRQNYYNANASWTLRYAVVDMGLNGGLGNVTLYDQLIDTALSQGYTLAQGDNADDIWLVTHRNATTNFLCYKITAAGLAATPVSSTAGTVSPSTAYNFKDLKTSHNGKLIAGLSYRDYSTLFAVTYSFVEVFAFDASTGMLTSKVRTTRGFGYFFTYQSVEFSPDDRLLYAGSMERIFGLQPCGFGAGNVYQYNLCYTDTASFTNYAMLVATDFVFCGSNSSWGRIQLGADKRIYMPYSGTTVSSIKNPNRLGSSANFLFNAHQVINNNYSVVVAPSFYHRELAKAVKNNIVYTGGCYPAPTTFSITNDTIASVVWNFGDVASASNTASSLTPQHLFSAPGFYTVTAQLYNGNGVLIETVTELIEIKDPAKRLLSGYPTDTSFCQGNSLKIKLNVVNGIFYWKERSPYTGVVFPLQTTDSITINSSGTYYVEMHQNDCNGCLMLDSIKVNVLPVPYLNLGPNTNLCSGDSLQFTGNDPAASYQWSTGDTTRSIWVHTDGSYWVQGELSNNGCPVRDTIVVTALPGVQFALPNDTTLCNNQTLTLAPGIANASYQWQDASSLPTYTVTQAGTYWVRVTAANGCRHSDTIRVAYVNAQSVSLGRDTSLCTGNALMLSANVPNAQYQWSTGATTAAIAVTQTGSYWLRVTNNGCTAADTINVAFNPPPAFSLGADTVLCNGQSLVLRPGISNASNQWSNGSTADTLLVNNPGLYWVDVRKGGCTRRDSILVAYKPLPVVNLGHDTVLCTGASLLLSALHPSVQAYVWQDGSVLSTYTVRAAGNYWVNVKGYNGCFNADTISITYKPLPSFSLGGDTTICNNQSLAYNINLSNGIYLWSNGSTANTISINQPGLYWLEVQQNGCVKRDSVSMDFKPLPFVDLGSDTTVCEGTALQLNAFNANATYLWSTNAATSTINITQPGLYWVKVNLNGCAASDSVSIAYSYLPKFSLGADTSLCNGQSFVLSPRTTGNYLWSDGSTQPTYTVTQPGTYSLTVTNNCGAASDAVVVTSGVCRLYMPNAFTPNGDGRNDDFRVKYPQFIKTFRMQVFNRWGQPVYTSTNPYEGWDGRSGSVNQVAGNYVWMITLTDIDGNYGVYKGNVVLIR